ncbi:MAG: hypothetical protein K0Q79_267 [Flavipsychrobacter sp.]|jgi:sugar lactone lactonase YvrE|nr:hypothetical protein [Flavipsychrobacter sp.]
MRKTLINILFSSITLWSFATPADAQTISTIAGSGPTGFMTGSYSGDGGPATAATLNNPSGAAFDSFGNLYIADSRNHRIRKVDASGAITTFAGTGITGYSGDGGQATVAELSYPESITFDAAGNLYFADRWTPCVRKIDPSGIITTVAGNGTYGFAGDGGPATAAMFDNPCYIKTDAAGNLYICDWINARLRKVNSAGIITTIAGNGSATYSGDGGPATAAGMRPSGVFIEPSGAILVSDGVNRRIRKIDVTGNITTIAGTGTEGYSGDGGPATSAQLRYPGALIRDASGNLLVCDVNNSVIRKIDAGGITTTVAGSGTNGFSGDGGVPTAAEFQFPLMVALNTAGQLFVPDMQNNRVRKIDLATVPAAIHLSALAGLKTYPNPAGNTLHIDGIAANTAYTFTDVTGQAVLQGTLGRESNILSLEALAGGLYFLGLNTGAGTKTILIVKE